MEITYRPANREDMKMAAKVHTACFPDYFLTSLGEALLEKYYTEFFEENGLFMLACREGENDGSEIIGFCMGYYRGSHARADFEHKYRGALSRRLLVLCLRGNRQAISRCFGKIKSVFSRGRKTPAAFQPDADLLSICVLPEYRGGRGVGTALIRAFEKRMEEQRPGQIRNCTLSVLRENAGARRVYEKCGFTLLQEGGEDVRYVKYYTTETEDETAGS